LNFSLT